MPSKKPQVVSYLEESDMTKLDQARAQAAKWAGVPISRSAYAKFIILMYLSKRKKG